jgi:hypothetical protein
MRTHAKQQRPDTARTFDGRLKLHMRELRLGSRVYRVVTLRPATAANFSTNFYHGTWHILSDIAGARLLARLLWGLSYQRVRGTLVLIHGEHLKPSPFDADPSNEIVLTVDGLTPHDPDDMRALRARLPRLGPLDRTVRWQTFGLDRLLGDEEERSGFWKLARGPGSRGERPLERERVSRCAGFVCYTAPRDVLRETALRLMEMRVEPHTGAPMDYLFLADQMAYGSEGEVQVFADYRLRLRQAALARREVLAEGDLPSDPAMLQTRIWQRRREIAARR